MRFDGGFNVSRQNLQTRPERREGVQQIAHGRCKADVDPSELPYNVSAHFGEAGTAQLTMYPSGVLRFCMTARYASSHTSMSSLSSILGTEDGSQSSVSPVMADVPKNILDFNAYSKKLSTPAPIVETPVPIQCPSTAEIALPTRLRWERWFQTAKKALRAASYGKFSARPPIARARSAHFVTRIASQPRQ